MNHFLISSEGYFLFRHCKILAEPIRFPPKITTFFMKIHKFDRFWVSNLTTSETF